MLWNKIAYVQRGLLNHLANCTCAALLDTCSNCRKNVRHCRLDDAEIESILNTVKAGTFIDTFWVLGWIVLMFIDVYLLKRWRFQWQRHRVAIHSDILLAWSPLRWYSVFTCMTKEIERALQINLRKSEYSEWAKNVMSERSFQMIFASKTKNPWFIFVCRCCSSTSLARAHQSFKRAAWGQRLLVVGMGDFDPFQLSKGWQLLSLLRNLRILRLPQACKLYIVII